MVLGNNGGGTLWIGREQLYSNTEPLSDTVLMGQIDNMEKRLEALGLSIVEALTKLEKRIEVLEEKTNPSEIRKVAHS